MSVVMVSGQFDGGGNSVCRGGDCVGCVYLGGPMA